MTLWRVDGKKATRIKETSFPEQQLEEADLENWIEANPKMLGESLMIIGRQVAIADLGDTIDLLALDQWGSLVVIELKRADLRAPVDIQGIRYASYVSRWTDEQLEEIYSGYASDSDDDDSSLQTDFLEFSDAAGAIEDVEFNADQRIFIVGQRIRDRLGSVALWLRDHDVDITIVELHPFMDQDKLYIEPLQIIPPPSTEQWEVGTTARKTDKPWLTDGKGFWRKMGTETQWPRLNSIINSIQEMNLLTRVSFEQKHYVALYRGKRTWIRAQALPSRIRLDVRCRKGDFDVKNLAKEIGLEYYDDSAELSEKRK